MTASPTTDIRILIIDDHAVVRIGLRMLLESQPGLQVIGEASNGHDALVLARQEQPGLILLDLDLDGESGLDLLPELLRGVSEARVIVLTGTRDSALHQQAMQRGARGVVMKGQAAEVLFAAITQVQAGGIWLDPQLTARMLSGMAGPSKAAGPDPVAVQIATLTEREREVIALIGEGLSNKQIAQRLSLSAATVNHHLTAIYSKLNVPSRLELMIYAYRNQLVKPPQ
jgi:DNA-binding NarL/FixJ family response regulator